MFKVKVAIVGVWAAFAGSMPAGAAGDRNTESPAGNGPATVWTFTIPSYRVLSQASFFDAIEKAERMGMKAIEGHPYKISAETGDALLAPSAPPEALEKTRRRLKAAGMTLVSYWAGDFEGDDATMRRLFVFGKAMGIQVFLGEPQPEKLAVLDKLANQFHINVAIHNHARRPGQPAYTNWDPDAVMKMVSRYSRRIGCCADTGHWVRSGLEPVECLKKYEGRVVYLHLKDVNEKGPRGHDVILGTGVGDTKGVLTELKRQKFAGPIAFEYENKVKDRMGDAARCVDIATSIAEQLGQKVQ